MDVYPLRLFQRQVALQCEIALRAGNELDAAVATDQPPWAAIQALLTAVGNLNKAFWGTRGRLAKEREDLRLSLGVDDATTPLDGPNLVRDHWEHFDERIDHWWNTSTSHNYLDSVGPTGQVAGIADTDTFRFYDTTTRTVRFWGDSFDLGAIRAEIERIYPIAVIEAAKPHW